MAANNHKNPFEGPGPTGAVLRFLSAHPYGFTSKDLRHNLKLKNKQSSSALTHCQRLGLVVRDNAAYLGTRYASEPAYINQLPPAHLQAPPPKSRRRKPTQQDIERRARYNARVDEQRKLRTVMADESARFHKELPRTPPSLDLSAVLQHNRMLP